MAKQSLVNRLTTGDGGIDFIGRTKLFYVITAALILISLASMLFRGFSMSIDFEGGTRITMPAGDLVAEEVEETFVEATGVTPEITQIVGSGDSETLEITSEHLSPAQIDEARLAIFEEHEPVDHTGKPSPDAIGDSTVSESWGDTITQRMLLSMVVFLVFATIYVAFRLQKYMAVAAMGALVVDGIVIAGIYSLFGFEVSPAVIIGLLTVLTFSIYDTVIVFDKVNENTEGVTASRRATYSEEANRAINQTVMRSISTSVISALPIIALFAVAVWLMGIGTLRDLALVQLIGVIEGIFSSIFLATPLLVSLVNRSKKIKKHNEEVAQYRARGEQGSDLSADAATNDDIEHRTFASLENAPVNAPAPETQRNGHNPTGSTWRPA